MKFDVRQYMTSIGTEGDPCADCQGKTEILGYDRRKKTREWCKSCNLVWLRPPVYVKGKS